MNTRRHVFMSAVTPIGAVLAIWRRRRDRWLSLVGAISGVVSLIFELRDHRQGLQMGSLKVSRLVS
jgi:hypothetical protein